MIASLGEPLADGDDLSAVAATFVLLTAHAGPLAACYAAGRPVPAGRRPQANSSGVQSPFE